MEQIKVLIADDHALIREGLHKILSIEPSIEVVGEASNGSEAINFVQRNLADVVLLDINMPVVNGITACRVIKEVHPEIKVIALTIHDQEEYLFEMLRAGISGYVLKDISPGELINVIFEVHKGNSTIAPGLTSRLIDEYKRLSSHERIDKYSELTEREYEVLKLVAAGESNKAIAEKLFISQKTVKNHLTSIFSKLNVTDRTQAAIFAVKSNLVGSAKNP